MNIHSLSILKKEWEISVRLFWDPNKIGNFADNYYNA